MQILLSNSQAGPGRTVKQEQDEISRNHIQAFIPGSVLCLQIGAFCTQIIAKPVYSLTALTNNSLLQRHRRLLSRVRTYTRGLRGQSIYLMAANEARRPN